MRVVLPDGERIRCGGKVIKNVSGYDMNKLFIGSLGTMGIVTEVTFKLLPMPATRATVVGVFRQVSQVASVVARTLESFLLPEALELLDPRALESARDRASDWRPAGYGLVVSLAGSPETVERQVRDFTKLFADGQAIATDDALAAADAEPAWRAIRDVHAPLKAAAASSSRSRVPIAKTLDLFAAAEELLGRRPADPGPSRPTRERHRAGGIRRSKPARRSSCCGTSSRPCAARPRRPRAAWSWRRRLRPSSALSTRGARRATASPSCDD